MARVILRSRPPVPPSIAASAGEALQHRFILRDVKQSAWRREVRFLKIALFAPRVCPCKFFSGDRNRRLCLGVDRKLREVFLSEIFPDKISTGRSATKSRGEASTVRQSKSICTSGIELKKMFSLNTFFYLSSAGDRAACEGAHLTFVSNVSL